MNFGLTVNGHFVAGGSLPMQKEWLFQAIGYWIESLTHAGRREVLVERACPFPTPVPNGKRALAERFRAERAEEAKLTLKDLGLL